jgi:hypothetical protein
MYDYPLVIGCILEMGSFEDEKYMFKIIHA